MSLFAKDSLLIIRSHHNHPNPSEQQSNAPNSEWPKLNGSKRRNPLLDQEAQAAAKRHRLMQQYRQQQQLQQQGSPVRPYSVRKSKKTVSFDFTKNLVYQRHLEQQDFDNAWLSDKDYENIRECMRQTVMMHREFLQNKYTGNADIATSLCMRGLEHQATVSLRWSRMSRIKQFHSLILSQQHILRSTQQTMSHVDLQVLLSGLSSRMSANAASEAVASAHRDAREVMFQDGRLKLPNSSDSDALHLTKLVMNKFYSLPALVIRPEATELHSGASSSMRRTPSKQVVQTLMNSQPLRNILSRTE